mgnify:CR=1 FL=1
MTVFWILIVATALLVGGALGSLAFLARQVPDDWERRKRSRLNADQIRLLTYALIGVIILFATMYELRLFYGL